MAMLMHPDPSPSEIAIHPNPSPDDIVELKAKGTTPTSNKN